MSIPRIYPDGATQASANGLGRLSDTTRLEVTEEINGIFELEMDYPIDGINFELIKKNRLIYVDKQFFQIYEISKSLSNIVTVYAEHISYRLSHIPVAPFTATGTPSQIWQEIKTHAVIDVPFDFESDIQDSEKFVIDKPRSIKDILMSSEDSFLSNFGGEFEWNNWNIKFNSRRGIDTSYVVRYGSNLTDIKQEENLQEVDTAIFPYAFKHEKDKDTVVYLPEKIIKTKNANLFSYTRILPVDFSDKFENDQIPTADALRYLSDIYIKDEKVGEPKVSIDVSFVDLAQTLEYKGMLSAIDLHLGDRMTVIYQKIGLHVVAEITKTVKEPLQDRFKVLHLGDFGESFTSSVIRNNKKTKVDLSRFDTRLEETKKDTQNEFEKQSAETNQRFEQQSTETNQRFEKQSAETNQRFDDFDKSTKEKFSKQQEELENQKDESERRYLEHNRKFTELQQETSDKIKSTKESMDYELSAHQQAINEQMEKAKKAIRAVEEKTAKEIDDARDSIMTFVSRNSEGAPLEFYDEQGKLVKGIPPVSTIKSKDGKFELNASGFNFGNHVLGGNGELYADGIYGNKIEGYSIIGAHISGGTIQGVTIEGDSYFRSSGSGGIAVVSGDSGFSFGACAMGSGHISIGTGNWNGTDFYTSGDVICSSVVVGGMALTSSDVAKLQRLKG